MSDYFLHHLDGTQMISDSEIQSVFGSRVFLLEETNSGCSNELKAAAFLSGVGDLFYLFLVQKINLKLKKIRKKFQRPTLAIILGCY